MPTKKAAAKSPAKKAAKTSTKQGAKSPEKKVIKLLLRNNSRRRIYK
jgi:hypothetical protein